MFRKSIIFVSAIIWFACEPGEEFLPANPLDPENENYISKFSSSSFDSYFAEHNKTNYEYLNLIKEMVKNLGLDCLKKQTRAILERPLLVHLLSKIKSRCLIISGDLDNLSTKEMNEELSNNIINSELCYIKNSGHFVMIEEEKNFNEIILNWLK